MNNNQIWNAWISKQKFDNNILQHANDIYQWITKKYPKLVLEIKWNQPMFSYNGTFIFAFSLNKKHISLAPEKVTLIKFENLIKESEYSLTSNTFKILANQPINYELIKMMIDFNIEDKKNFKTYFRPINC